MSYIEENGYFIFEGVKSSDYGVWISGGGTFNAPARRYKEYVVPGRNGVLTIDEGAYEEAEVTYPAFIARDFPANVEAFRNAIMAQNGYVRMTDSYHPDEYYLARYMAGLEVDTLPAGIGGSFELTFKRDPRRFLLSGEESIAYPPGVEHRKNLIPYPFATQSETKNGITFTVSNDGSIAVSGTATAGTNFSLVNYTLQLEQGETYVLSGCPKGGGQGKYRISIDGTSGMVGDSKSDYGDGLTFAYSGNLLCSIYINISSGVTLDSIVFRPMLRKASDPDGWEPYYDGATNIYNPTLFNSNPLIRVTGYGTVTIGSDVITIVSGYSYVDIDSETQNCYCGSQNANSVVSFSSGNFPQLKPGISGISYSSGINNVAITPRWYRV